jgi:hypothetical protein
MLTLISTLLGLLTSGLPKLLDFFQNKADQSHELKLAAIQNERDLALAAQGFAAQAKIEEIKTEQVAMQTQAQMEQAAAEGIKSAHEHDKALLAKASPWVSNLNGLVRPAVTFIFVLELVGINVFLCWYMWNQPGLITDFTSLMAYIDQVFTVEEMSMLGAIIGYWFGSRGWSKK